MGAEAHHRKNRDRSSDRSHHRRKKRIIKKLTDEIEDQIKKISNEAEEKIMTAKLKLYERLKEIAAEQDEFEDEFRNYVATLPNPDSYPKTGLD